ncbi:MAG TPA: hypothetical protein VI542_04380 [Candidatus Tectomicrobia bacterium]
MQKWTVIFLSGCLLLASPSHAVVFHDGASNAQRIFEFGVQQAREIKKYAEMVTTAQQMVEQVKGTYRMIEMAAQHLKEMPTDGSIFTWLTSMDAQASALLGHVQWLGFGLDQTTRQFEVLYGNTTALLTPEGRAERYRQMRAARLEMTNIAMQTQSIRQTFTGIYARLSTLLGISSWAEGTRALQQIQMQQQALAQQQQQVGLTMQAVSARLVAMQQAEEIVRQALEEQAAAHNAQVWYGGMAPALPAGFNGFRILPGAQ